MQVPISDAFQMYYYFIFLYDNLFLHYFRCSLHSGQGIIQKTYGRIGFWQSQKRLQLGGLGGAVSPPGDSGRCLGEGMGVKPLSIFFFFFFV